MDQQESIIQQLLNELANEEIPDDMNLWPNIKQQLEQKPASRWHVFHSASRLVAALLIFTTIGAVGFALQQINTGDPTIPADEITALNLQQTIEGVTTTLDWAYADEHRISLHYSTTYISGEAVLADYAFVTLKTADGTLIPSDYGGGGGGGGGGAGTEIVSASLANFNPDVIAELPETLELSLSIQYGGEPPEGSTAPPGQMPPGSGSGGGGGGGGGGAPAGAAPPATPDVNPADIPVRTFTFDFSVPVLPARTGEVETDVVEANGMVMRLKNVRVTPSMTKFTICTNAPETEKPLLPQMVLDTGVEPELYNHGVIIWSDLDGNMVFGTSLSSPFAPAEDGWQCANAYSPAPVTNDTTSIRLVVDYLYREVRETVTDEMIDSEAAFFAGRGFDLSFERTSLGRHDVPQGALLYPLISQNEALLVTINHYPEAMESWQAEYYVMSQLFRERQEGPWEFTISLP